MAPPFARTEANMPDKSFKVNVYEVVFPQEGDDEEDDLQVSIPTASLNVQTPFEDAINDCSQTPLVDRYGVANGKGRRLEHCDTHDGCNLLNLVTFEFPGPGRSTERAPAMPMGLQVDEYFSHETAMLYDPETHLAFVESTLGSMGPGAIAHYFERFAPGTNYQLVPRLDAEASARARRQREIRSIQTRVAIGPITQADRNAGTSAILALGENLEGGLVNIEISVGPERKRSLSIAGVWNLVESLTGGSAQHDVKQLRLNGRENEDDPLELIDLLEHREKRERQLPIDMNSRTVDHTVRWRSLIEIHGGFA